MQLGRDLHRLRDGDRPARRPAAAGADERGRRPHGDPGRRALPGEGAGRARHAARRRAGRARRPRSSSSAAASPAPTPSRMAMGMEAQCHVHRHRSSTRLYAARPAVRRRSCNTHLLDRDAIEDYVARGRSGDRRGAGAGRRGAQADHPRRWSSAMKPGSVLVDIAIDQGGCFETSPADHARRPDLCRGRRRALLRHQHAGRGGAHLDLRAQQRHAALRAGAGRQGLAPGAARTTRIWPTA